MTVRDTLDIITVFPALVTLPDIIGELNPEGCAADAARARQFSRSGHERGG